MVAIAHAWLPLVYGAGLTLAAKIPATSTTTTAAAQFTIPSAADNGANLLANLDDPEAVNAQSVCPGYIASNVHHSASGLSATLKLAGKACNVYGTDVETLNLTVEYQARDRLNILITPTYITPANQSWFVLSEDLVPRPKADSKVPESDFIVSWSNDPSFSFKVVRKATGDVLFSTEGTVLVYEDQFVEFVTSLPEDYNLYGLGERIQGLRLLNNLNITTYAADVGDPVDTYVLDPASMGKLSLWRPPNWMS